MKQLLKLSFFIILGTFAVFNFTSAQINNYPNQQIPQNQQPPIIQPSPTPEPISQPVPQKTTPAQTTPKTTQTPLPENISNQTSTPQASSANSSYSFIPYFAIIAALALAFFWKKLLELFKEKKGTEPTKENTELPAEAEKIPCPTCGGTGKITKHRMVTVPCDHCKSTGNDICHFCGGSGHYGGGLTVPQAQDEVDGMKKCDWCEGNGWDKFHKACCMCHGTKKESYQEAYQVPCPTCKGIGLVNNY